MAVTASIWQNYISNKTKMRLEEVIEKIKIENSKERFVRDAIYITNPDIFIALAKTNAMIKTKGKKDIRIGNFIKYSVFKRGIEPNAERSDRVNIKIDLKYIKEVVKELGSHPFVYSDERGRRIEINNVRYRMPNY